MGHGSSELADRVVAVCLGELNDTLPSSETLMHSLDLGDPVATLQETEPVDINDLDAESIAWYLKDSATAERCHEIEQGAPLTSFEQEEVARRATHSSFEQGIFSSYEYFRLNDSKGRSAYFVAQANSDCGSDFPHSNHEGPLATLPYQRDTEEQLRDGTVRNFVIYG
jgi:hypothetical protein